MLMRGLAAFAVSFLAFTASTAPSAAQTATPGA